jgi:uncharacterized repeat protein (TIGR03847 family)
MAEEIELRPVTHITVDALGQPGKRVFYLHGWQQQRTVTLILEKIQVQSLAVGVEQFLAEIQMKFPDLSDASADYSEERMRILPPVDPLFRVGELGLGYEGETDMVVLVAREIQAEDDEEAETGVVRFWCTRSQIRALARWGVEVASRGRPLCPQCGEPMNPEGHFCPKRNGHKH